MQQLILNRNNPRRFGTAKRLGETTDTRKCYFFGDIFDNLELLMYMKYHLSFGSAKPTKREILMQQLIFNRNTMQKPKRTPHATDPQ